MSSYVKSWQVKSFSNPAVAYKVSVTNTGKYACSCPAWIYHRGEKVECKHIRHVKSQNVEVD